MSNQTSPAGEPLKPNTTRNTKIVVLAVVMILGLSIAAFCLLYEYLNNPPVFVWKNRQFKIITVNFGGTPSNASNYINMTIQNTNTSPYFTIDAVAKVNGVSKTLAEQVTIAAGSSAIVKIPNVNWNSGQQYSIELFTADGTKITYVTNAPA